MQSSGVNCDTADIQETVKKSGYGIEQDPQNVEADRQMELYIMSHFHYLTVLSATL